jgi:hypothetical protein
MPKPSSKEQELLSQREALERELDALVRAREKNQTKTDRRKRLPIP